MAHEIFIEKIAPTESEKVPPLVGEAILLQEVQQQLANRVVWKLHGREDAEECLQLLVRNYLEILFEDPTARLAFLERMKKEIQ